MVPHLVRGARIATVIACRTELRELHKVSEYTSRPHSSLLADIDFKSSLEPVTICGMK